MNSSTNVTRHPSIGDEKQSPARVFTANNTPSYLNSFDNMPMPTEDFVVDVLPGLRRLLYPQQRGCPYSGGGIGRALPARQCLRPNGRRVRLPRPPVTVAAPSRPWLRGPSGCRLWRCGPSPLDPRSVPPPLPHRHPGSGLASSVVLVVSPGCAAARGPGSGQSGPGRNRTRA